MQGIYDGGPRESEGKERQKREEEESIIRFYKTVLHWDYDQLIEETENENKIILKRVKNTYHDVDDYLSTFERLVFQEAKAWIVENHENDYRAKKMPMVITDCLEADEFHLFSITYRPGEGESISADDLLLLSTDEGPELIEIKAFALVEHSQGISLRLKMYLAGEDFKGLLASSESTLSKTMFGRKICSLSTVASEYIALRSIGSLPFKDLILKATEKVSGFQDQSWKIPEPLHGYIKENHDVCQLEAIYECLSGKPFVLIQGPPGTGKTRTILGILSAILHATPARIHSRGGLRRRELSFEEKQKNWLRASPWLTGTNPRDNVMPIDGDAGFFPTTGNDLKPEVVNISRKYRFRVLVCARSNSALDEIVLRLLETGVRDKDGRTCKPKVVRVGLKSHRSINSVDIDHLVDKQKLGGTRKDEDSIRSAILNEAVIVCSTLSDSPLLSKLKNGFDIVIIDEADKAVEPATLIPLLTGCKQVFLVGDPVQLPATVISNLAQEYGYGTSLFKRLQEAGYPVKMLKTQYRMHPQICSFPSDSFYDGELRDGAEVEYLTTREWHEYHCFGPVYFYDILEGEESSWFVLHLHQKLVSMYPCLMSSSELAIICPSGEQVNQFKEALNKIFGSDSQEKVDITTVDDCQGREKDVVIFYCVRSNEAGKAGSVEESRQMNVAITRAKSTLLVVGSKSTFQTDKNKHWKSLIDRAEKDGCVSKVSKPYDLYFSDEYLESMKVNSDMEAQAVGSDWIQWLSDHSNMEVYGGDMDEENVSDKDGYAERDEDDSRYVQDWLDSKE